MGLHSGETVKASGAQLRERLILSSGRRALVSVLSHGSARKDALRQLADVLTVPEPPTAMYMNTVLEILPGDNVETMDEAEDRVRSHMGAIVDNLHSMAAGEVVDLNRIAEIDTFVVAASELATRNHSFGKFIILQAVN